MDVFCLEKDDTTIICGDTINVHKFPSLEKHLDRLGDLWKIGHVNPAPPPGPFFLNEHSINKHMTM
jgi:hypothetical protein